MQKLVTFLVLFLVGSSSFAQSTLLVPEQFTGIQAAVDAAVDGDTVSVAPGTYFGTVKILGKNVHLVSRGDATNTTIDASTSPFGRGLEVSNGLTTTSIIRGFTIQNGGASNLSGGGIRVDNSSPYFVNCIVRDNVAGSGAGISVGGGATTMVNCLFTGNVAYDGGAAIKTSWNTGAARFSNCTVTDNTLLLDPYIASAFVDVEQGDALFTNGIVYGNHVWSALDWSVFGPADKCNVGQDPSGSLPAGFISEDPQFLDSNAGNYGLGLGSPSRDTGSATYLLLDVADLDGDGDVSEPVPFDLNGNPRVLDSEVDMGCFEADAGPITYCAAKVNSCGSLPTIGATGLPSAAAASGFTVAAQNTRAGKLGLLVYADAGQATLPFGGGTLCVAAPRRRSVQLTDTTGTPGLCDGTLSIDMNAFAAGSLGGNPAAYLLVPGTRINAQFWGRDTPGNVTLSDALEYWVNP